MNPIPTSADDPWHQWLLHQRQGGDPGYEASVRALVATYVERLLDRADLQPGQTLLDVGCGEGGVGLRAIARTGAALRVVMSDSSAALLQHAEQAAIALDVAAQCRFVHASADTLAGVADASVDVVTTRSVLAYVLDKRRALSSFWRVLRPGGRLVLAEPVFQDEAFEASLLRHRLEQTPPAQRDLGLELMHRWKAAQFPDTSEAIAANPMTSYSERDLLRMAAATGFKELHLELDVRMTASRIPSWDVLLDITPHPWAPSLRSILAERFSAEEADAFEAVMRARLDQGLLPDIDRMAYLSALKP